MPCSHIEGGKRPRDCVPTDAALDLEIVGYVEAVVVVDEEMTVNGIVERESCDREKKTEKEWLGKPARNRLGLRFLTGRCGNRRHGTYVADEYSGSEVQRCDVAFMLERVVEEVLRYPKSARSYGVLRLAFAKVGEHSVSMTARGLQFVKRSLVLRTFVVTRQVPKRECVSLWHEFRAATAELRMRMSVTSN